jgi:thiol-disulfide isomerase/thioredoxin
MRNNALAKAICFDLLASLVALVAIGIAAVWTPLADSQLRFVMEALLFVAVGFVRGQSLPANGYLKAFLLVSPCTLVLATFALVLAWGGLRVIPFMLGLIAGISYPAALAGIAGRHAWAVNRTRSVATMAIVTAAIGVGSVLGARVFADWLATRRAKILADEFSVARLDGAVVNSSELKRRVVVLDFWATWCVPCPQEFPELERLYRRYQANPRVAFLAIDVNTEGESPEKAREFLQKAGYTIPAAYLFTGLRDL